MSELCSEHPKKHGFFVYVDEKKRMEANNMGIYKYIREAWKKPKENLGELYKQRILQWRSEPVTLRIERPTRLDAARSLGYRAKPGILIIRQRVARGGHQRPKRTGGRRSKHSGSRKNLTIGYQLIAEQRAAENYSNCEVMGSYFVAKDGMSYWYEVLLVDRNHPQVLADKQLSQIASGRGRVYRGLTQAAKRSRLKFLQKGN